jgi:hypothetical protein
MHRRLKEYSTKYPKKTTSLCKETIHKRQSGALLSSLAIESRSGGKQRAWLKAFASWMRRLTPIG